MPGYKLTSFDEFVFSVNCDVQWETERNGGSTNKIRRTGKLQVSGVQPVQTQRKWRRTNKCSRASSSSCMNAMQLPSDSSPIDPTPPRRSRSELKRRPGIRRNRSASQKKATDRSPQKPVRSRSDPTLVASSQNTNVKSKLFRHPSDPPKRSTPVQKPAYEKKSRSGSRRNRSTSRTSREHSLPPRKPTRSRSDNAMPICAEITTDQPKRSTRHKMGVSHGDPIDKSPTPNFQSKEQTGDTFMQHLVREKQYSNPMRSSESWPFDEFSHIPNVGPQRSENFDFFEDVQKNKNKVAFSGITQHLNRRKSLAYNRVPSTGRLF